MNECAEVKDLLVLHAEGELEPKQLREVSAHLASCTACRRQASDIGKVRAWLVDPEIFSSPEDEAWHSLAADCASRLGGAPKQSRFGRIPLRWALPVAAALMLAVGVVWMVRRSSAPSVSAGLPAPGNEAFLGRIQSAMTMDSTARYLVECQDLLVNILKAGQTCRGNKYDVAFEVARARELLERKRMLDPELSTPEVARAKDLCDELEDFLVNLSLSQDCETPDTFRLMELFIERQQLLLRIRLVRSEMS